MFLRYFPKIKKSLSFATFLLFLFYSFSPTCLKAQSRLHVQTSFSLLVGHQATNVAKSSEEWLGIYLSKKKVGYSSSVASPTLYEGKPAIREVGAGVTKLTVLGTSVEEEESTETISDLEHRPLFQSFDVKSNGSAIHVVAKFDYAAKKIECVIGVGADASKKTVEIPDGADLVADPNAVSWQAHRSWTKVWFLLS